MIQIPQKLIDAGARVRVYATCEGCGVGLLIRTPRNIMPARVHVICLECLVAILVCTPRELPPVRAPIVDKSRQEMLV
jgi:hypothetical protein